MATAKALSCHSITVAPTRDRDSVAWLQAQKPGLAAFASQFYGELPDQPYCATRNDDGDIARIFITSKATAVKYPEIQINHTRAWVRWLIFDVDREGAFEAADDASLPPPTFITISRRGHAHLAYRLKAPVFVGRHAKKKPQVFLKSVFETMQAALVAERRYKLKAATTHNPFSPLYRTIWSGKSYDLAELASESGTVYKAKVDSDQDADSRAEQEVNRYLTAALGKASFSRHCELFDTCRKEAYKLHGNSYAVIHAFCLDFLANRNRSFGRPLGTRDLITTATSIAKFVDTKYRPHGHRPRQDERPEVGAMGYKRMCGLSYGEYLVETRCRQAAGGKWAAAVRRRGMLEVIRQARAALATAGEQITQTKVAIQAGVSLSSVKRLWRAQIKK